MHIPAFVPGGFSAQCLGKLCRVHTQPGELASPSRNSGIIHGLTPCGSARLSPFHGCDGRSEPFDEISSLRLRDDEEKLVNGLQPPPELRPLALPNAHCTPR